VTAAAVITVWFFAPVVGAALLVASGRAVDARRRRRAVRDLATCRAILAAPPAPEPCPEHGHACQPHDHQTPGGTR
jgi:hypothetical protein